MAVGLPKEEADGGADVEAGAVADAAAGAEAEAEVLRAWGAAGAVLPAIETGAPIAPVAANSLEVGLRLGPEWQAGTAAFT